MKKLYHEAYDLWKRLDWAVYHRASIHLSLPPGSANDDEYLQKLTRIADKAWQRTDRRWRKWCAASR